MFFSTYRQQFENTSQNTFHSKRSSGHVQFTFDNTSQNVFTQSPIKIVFSSIFLQLKKNSLNMFIWRRINHIWEQHF